jgi:hypothetical protein
MRSPLSTCSGVALLCFIECIVVTPVRGDDWHPTYSQATNIGSEITDRKKSSPEKETLRSTEGSTLQPDTGNEKDSEKAAGAVAPMTLSPAEREIELGDLLEQQDQLDDAEKAYAKALETATGAEREDAKRHLEKLLAKKQGLKTKYFDPWFNKFGTSFSEVLFGVLGAIPALLLLWGLKRALKSVGNLFGKKKLRIGEFVDATGNGAALAFAEIMKHVVEEVMEYYKPRDRFLHGAFGSLVILESPGSEELVDLAAEVVPGGWSKLLAFITRGLFKPEYFITGMIQEAGFQYGFLVKLIRNGATIQTWQHTVPAWDVSRLQDDLALDVAMHLKEIVEANGR